MMFKKCIQYCSAKTNNLLTKVSFWLLARLDSDTVIEEFNWRFGLDLQNKNKVICGHSTVTLKKHFNEIGQYHSDTVVEEFSRRYNLIVKRRCEVSTVIKKEYPPILLTTMPKSASNFIVTSISSILEIPRTRIDLGLFPDDNLDIRGLDKLSLGNSFGKGHFPASGLNLHLLSIYGFKIVVHVRDPREVLVSWVHHVDKHLDSVQDFDSRSVLALMKPTLPTNYKDWSFEKKIDFQIDTFLPQLIAWTKEWELAVKQEYFRENLLITSYEDLQGAEPAFMRKLFKFFNICDADLKLSKMPQKEITSNFREGKKNSWQSQLSVTQTRKISQLVTPDILRFTKSRERHDVV